jgi:ATP-dependent protease ClpP protease subunit
VKKSPWFNFVSKAPDNATVMIYGEIGKNGVSAIDFIQELNAIAASKINVRMHSPGGDVFGGMLIYEALKASKAEVNIQVDGVAASIASAICMAGKVTMAKSAMMMVHRPYAMSGGNAEEMRSACDALDQIAGNMVDAYSGKTGIPAAQITEMMRAETWLNAEKCKALGFCDSIGTMGAINAAVDFSGFSNVPDEVRAMFNEKELPTNERDLEAILRDAGLTKKEALTAIAGLKTEALRDSEAADAQKFKEYLQIEAMKSLLR